MERGTIEGWNDRSIESASCIFALFYLYLQPTIINNCLKQILSMKTKLFLAAVAVAFSFAVISCGNKPANTEVAAESVEVETVEAAPCCKADSAACDSTKACCKEKAECEKKACDKK